MYQAYAEILGRHATDVIKKMSGFKPKQIDMLSEPAPTNNQVNVLSIEVDFAGDLDLKPVKGNFVFSLKNSEDAIALAQAVAKNLKLDPGVAKTPEGVVNILAELLNIIIGLTGAGWAKSNLHMAFGPPQVTTGKHLPSLPMGTKTYRITIDFDGVPSVQIAIRFIPQTIG